jgi:hypothetical protein
MGENHRRRKVELINQREMFSALLTWTVSRLAIWMLFGFSKKVQSPNLFPIEGPVIWKHSYEAWLLIIKIYYIIIFSMALFGTSLIDQQGIDAVQKLIEIRWYLSDILINL